MATKVRRDVCPVRDRAEYKAALMDALATGVDSLVAEDAPGLGDDPRAVAARMIAAVPRAHVYDDLVGPFYGTDAVRRMLGGVSRQAVHDRANRRTLLQVRTSDGVSLYPAFQFEGDGVSPRVRRVLSAFRDVPVDGWAVATWFSVPAVDLDGLTPRDWLGDLHRDDAMVLALAQRAAIRWAAP